MQAKAREYTLIGGLIGTIGLSGFYAYRQLSRTVKVTWDMPQTIKACTRYTVTEKATDAFGRGIPNLPVGVVVKVAPAGVTYLSSVIFLDCLTDSKGECKWTLYHPLGEHQTAPSTYTSNPVAPAVLFGNTIVFGDFTVCTTQIEACQGPCQLGEGAILLPKELLGFPLLLKPQT
jgi:hypothetical protein